MKKILVTGVLGQVGYELQRSLQPFGNVIGIDKDEMDLTNPDSIRKFVRDLKPDIIVNPAAYTAVDLAEKETELCMAINKDAARVLAEEALKLDAWLIHYSTDYIFDGSSTKPYLEDDLPNPLNVYGETKLAGEKAIQEIGGKHLILRTSWVYGARGKNFLLTMLKLGSNKDQLNIVADQIGAPTWSRMLAECTAQILAKIPHQKNDCSGVYHLTSEGVTSWLDFADKIFSIQAKRNPEFNKPQLSGILTKDYKTDAMRPLNSKLCNDKLFNTFGIRMPDWQTSLKLCMNDLDS